MFGVAASFVAVVEVAAAVDSACADDAAATHPSTEMLLVVSILETLLSLMMGLANRMASLARESFGTPTRMYFLPLGTKLPNLAVGANSLPSALTTPLYSVARIDFSVTDLEIWDSVSLTLALGESYSSCRSSKRFVLGSMSSRMTCSADASFPAAAALAALSFCFLLYSSSSSSSTSCRSSRTSSGILSMSRRFISLDGYCSLASDLADGERAEALPLELAFVAEVTDAEEDLDLPRKNRLTLLAKRFLLDLVVSADKDVSEDIMLLSSPLRFFRRRNRPRREDLVLAASGSTMVVSANGAALTTCWPLRCRLAGLVVNVTVTLNLGLTAAM
mmetsp:Transcript_23319/g.66067  ORF Transcript_23319/g.66067 Transcript_23319/m.66067 type:complete len:333 (-) Transcript_23319:439-1437(-)